MTQPSPSSETNNQPKPCLLRHYEAKRQRTITLVKVAVDQLVKEKQTVTIEAICRTSSTLDPEGRGVKKSAILENPEAHAYYRKHSTSYQMAKNRNRQVRKSDASASTVHPLRIDPQRDMDRARYRYLQMTKTAIVERLLTVEQAYAELYLQLSQLQFQVLEQEQLKAEEQRQALRQSKRKGGNAQQHEGTGEQ